MPFIGKQPKVGAYQLIDSITTSATATYALTVNGTAFNPESARNLIVSLNGITQAPESAYTVSGTNIVFDSALTSSDVIDYILVIGDAVDIGTPSDGTVGTAQMNYPLGNFSSTGIDDNADAVAITVDSSERVGIGTTNPANGLHVKNSSSTPAKIESSGSSGSFALFSDDDSAVYFGNNGASGDAVIWTGSASNGSGGSEKVRVDSSGKVGIGTTSPSDYHSLSQFVVAQSGDAGITIASGTSNDGRIFFADGTSGSAESEGTIRYDHSDDSMHFSTSDTVRMSIASNGEATFGNDVVLTNTAYVYSKAGGSGIRAGWQLDGTNQTVKGFTGGSERLRFDNSGELLIGKTALDNTNSGFRFVSGEAAYASFVNTSTTGAHRNIVCNRQSSNGTAIQFDRSNSTVGEITISSSSTSYGTSSDYRLKENIVDLDNAIDRVKQIPVYRFNFIAEPDVTVDGFLAHEVADIVPEAITGTKDAVDDDQNPKYQVIDQSKLVPLLTAAIKQQQTIIEDLQTRLSALEAN